MTYYMVRRNGETVHVEPITDATSIFAVIGHSISEVPVDDGDSQSAHLVTCCWSYLRGNERATSAEVEEVARQIFLLEHKAIGNI